MLEVTYDLTNRFPYAQNIERNITDYNHAADQACPQNAAARDRSSGWLQQQAAGGHCCRFP
jgi:hypothetical protein